MSIGLHITNTSFPDGYEGTPYFQNLTAASGTLPYEWYLYSGYLPAGLSINVSGYISGTPSSPDPQTFEIQVVDNLLDDDIVQFTINTYGPTTPVIGTTSLPNGALSVAYSQTVSATGGVTPYTWSISAGTLPTGLSINSGTGEIYGTPTVAGGYSFTVQVVDNVAASDTQGLTITIPSASPTIITTSVPGGTVGVSYSQNVTATGGDTPYTDWAITSGSLPPGLSLTPSPTVGTISGSPTTVGTYNFDIEVTDTSLATDTQSLTIEIVSAAVPNIATTSLTGGVISVAYSETVTASGGSLPYVWSVYSGSLPTGLSLNASTGEISGTPTTAGSYVFVIKVTDNIAQIDTQSLGIVIVASATPTIITTSLPNWTKDVAYSQYVYAINGFPSYTWTVNSGSLPTGLSPNASTGLVSGIPTVLGTYVFELKVTDSLASTDLQSYSVTISDSSVPIITTSSIPDGMLAIAFNKTIIGSGGTLSYTWSITSGALPTGLSLNTSTGVISGTPSAIGSFSFTIRVTDAIAQYDEQSLEIIINDTGFGSDCCFCVFTDEIVTFSNNSSGNGILTATGGIIIGNSVWQAPPDAGIYLISMTIEGVSGIEAVTNTITVIAPVRLVDNTSPINDLLPGDSMQLYTNYPAEQVMWTTMDCDIPVVTPSGKIVINTNPADSCFGALACTVRGYLLDNSGCDAISYVDVKINVNPTYPSPRFCGPNIIKWKRESKDFKVIISEFEGGCDETHIRNKVPIIKWSVDYQGLANIDASFLICESCGSSGGTCKCEVGIFESNPNGCLPSLQTSNRLDDFWNLVYGQYQRFTLVDEDTDEVWYNVRFDKQLDSDHVHRRRSTSRSVGMVWKPCCNKSPAGGTCSQHGMTNYKCSTATLSPSACNHSSCTFFCALDSANHGDIALEDKIFFRDTSENDKLKYVFLWEIINKVPVTTTLINKTYDIVTASLANLAYETGTFVADTIVLATKLTTNVASRVRVYTTEAYRNSDISRAIGVDISGEQGLLLEVITDAGNLVMDIAPTAILNNMSGDVSDQTLYYTIDNVSGGTSIITANIEGITFNNSPDYLPLLKDYSITTASIANAVTASNIITIDKIAVANKLTVTQPCRVRLYVSSAYRSADLSRGIGIDITGEHGMLLEAVFVSGNLELDLSPTAMLYTLTGDTKIYYSIENMSGGTTTIGLTISSLVLQT